jgi:SMI1 / KNR4 family (SUKH-1)
MRHWIMSQAVRAIYDTLPVHRFPLPTEEQVRELERRLKIPLPGHYRQFILEFNGGCFQEPWPLITPVHDDAPLEHLSDLWGIGADYPHAELGHDTCNFDDNDPPIVLPIGYTVRNCLLYLGTEDAPDYGSVCVKLAFCWTVFVIADTMDEFFGLLRSEQPKSY